MDLQLLPRRIYSKKGITHGHDSICRRMLIEVLFVVKEDWKLNVQQENIG